MANLKLWYPKKGEWYYRWESSCVTKDESYALRYTRNYGSTNDVSYFIAGNCFPTAKTAKVHMDELIAWYKLHTDALLKKKYYMKQAIKEILLCATLGAIIAYVLFHGVGFILTSVLLGLR